MNVGTDGDRAGDRVEGLVPVGHELRLVPGPAVCPRARYPRSAASSGSSSRAPSWVSPARSAIPVASRPPPPARPPGGRCGQRAASPAASAASPAWTCARSPFFALRRRGLPGIRQHRPGLADRLVHLHDLLGQRGGTPGSGPARRAPSPLPPPTADGPACRARPRSGSTKTHSRIWLFDPQPRLRRDQPLLQAPTFVSHTPGPRPCCQTMSAASEERLHPVVHPLLQEMLGFVRPSLRRLCSTSSTPGPSVTQLSVTPAERHPKLSVSSAERYPKLSVGSAQVRLAAPVSAAADPDLR